MILIIIPWGALLAFAHIKNNWLNFFFEKGLGTFGLVFSLMSVYDWFCLKIRLYDSQNITVVQSSPGPKEMKN